jgi:molecular chaperone IbpA
MSLHPEDMIMLNYDFSPFYRSTIGFDRLLGLLDKTAGLEASAPSYPPYNIERTGENAYRISLAVAGFADDELSVETREGVLTVRGAKSAQEKDERRETLYQGIAARAFERRFHLADHVAATQAACENGLLHIDLVREVPEAQKPRAIPIQAAAKTIETRITAQESKQAA